jgi:hypothetical protein
MRLRSGTGSSAETRQDTAKWLVRAGDEDRA